MLLEIDILDMTDDNERTHPWVVRSYNLSEYLDCESDFAAGFRDNGKAEAMVREHVIDHGGVLFVRDIEFASEMGCFFAYAKDYITALALVGYIHLQVATHMRRSTRV